MSRSGVSPVHSVAAAKSSTTGADIRFARLEDGGLPPARSPARARGINEHLDFDQIRSLRDDIFCRHKDALPAAVRRWEGNWPGSGFPIRVYWQLRVRWWSAREISTARKSKDDSMSGLANHYDMWCRRLIGLRELLMLAWRERLDTYEMLPTTDIYCSVRWTPQSVIFADRADWNRSKAIFQLQPEWRFNRHFKQRYVCEISNFLSISDSAYRKFLRIIIFYWFRLPTGHATNDHYVLFNH